MSGAVAKKPWGLIQVLGDLLRWQFGELLIQRAGWSGAEPGDVNLAVQEFRRRILAGCLRLNGLDPQALSGLPQDPAAWEPILVAEFLDDLRALAPLGSAEDKLTRFAHGQYFKYSRRVALLMQLESKLPCAYAGS
jgi:hypothetical protein